MSERAFEEEQWSVAIALIEAQPASQRTPADWLRLARSRARLGQLVEAYEAYDRFQELNLDTAERALSTAEADALAARLSWLTVLVPDELRPGDRIWIDQRAVEPQRLASPYPLNPGSHSVMFERAGRAQSGYRIHVGEADRQTVDLRDLSGGPHEPSTARAWGAPIVSAQPREVTDSRWANPLRTTAYIGLGLGGLSAVVGTVFAFRAEAMREEVASRCTAGNCEDVAALRAREGRYSRGASIGLVAGGLGLLTGGVLFLLSSDDAKSTTSAWRMGADPSLDVANVAVVRAF